MKNIRLNMCMLLKGVRALVIQNKETIVNKTIMMIII